MATRPLTRTIAGRTLIVDVEVHDDGPDGLTVSMREARVAELTMAAAIAFEDPPSADGMRFMRRVLGLSVEKLAALLGLPLETLLAWEASAAAIERNAWLSLGTLVLERAHRPAEARARLSRLAEGHVPAAVRHLSRAGSSG